MSFYLAYILIGGGVLVFYIFCSMMNDDLVAECDILYTLLFVFESKLCLFSIMYILLMGKIISPI